MTKKTKDFILALIVMALWGSLFPMIKISYRYLAVDTGFVPSIILYAGLRFVVSGVVLSGLFLAKKQKPDKDIKSSIVPILLTGLFAIILHYPCSYVGLALTASSQTAILKQSGALIYIVAAPLFLKSEKFTVQKLIGGIIGFLGIIAIGSGKGGFSLSIGDILILGASVCTVASSIATKKAVQKNSPIVVTGTAQLFGGVTLVLAAALSGGKLPTFNPIGTLSFLYICAASMIAYCLWSKLLSDSEISGMFIIKFAEPVFATIFGGILLHEDIFRIQYLAAFVLISSGILLAHRKPKKKAEVK